MTEYFDIYNENKEKLGIKMARQDAFLKEGQYQLIVLAILEDKSAKILATKRAMNKKWAPGAWEIPGGGVIAGESSKEAIIREVKEETGLDVGLDSGKLIFTYKNEDSDRGDNYIVDIYHFILDINKKDIIIDPNEAMDANLLSLKECEEYNKQGLFLHYERMMQALASKGAYE